MKKLKSFFACLAVAVFASVGLLGFTACGNKEDENPTEPTTPPVSYTVSEETWKSELKVSNLKNFTSTMTSTIKDSQGQTVGTNLQSAKFADNKEYYYLSSTFGVVENVYEGYVAWESDKVWHYRPVEDEWHKEYELLAGMDEDDPDKSFDTAIASADGIEAVDMLAEKYDEFPYDGTTHSYKATVDGYSYELKFENNKLVSASTSYTGPFVMPDALAEGEEEGDEPAEPALVMSVDASMTNIGTTTVPLPNVPEKTYAVTEYTWYNALMNITNCTVSKDTTVKDASGQITSQTTESAVFANDSEYWTKPDNTTGYFAWEDGNIYLYVILGEGEGYTKMDVTDNDQSYPNSYELAMLNQLGVLTMIVDKYEAFTYDRATKTYKVALNAQTGEVAEEGDETAYVFELKFENDKLVWGTAVLPNQESETTTIVNASITDVGTSTVTLPQVAED